MIGIHLTATKKLASSIPLDKCFIDSSTSLQESSYVVFAFSEEEHANEYETIILRKERWPQARLSVIPESSVGLRHRFGSNSSCFNAEIALVDCRLDRFCCWWSIDGETDNGHQ
jgi:hypothetical protein